MPRQGISGGNSASNNERNNKGEEEKKEKKLKVQFAGVRTLNLQHVRQLLTILFPQGHHAVLRWLLATGQREKEGEIQSLQSCP